MGNRYYSTKLIAKVRTPDYDSADVNLYHSATERTARGGNFHLLCALPRAVVITVTGSPPPHHTHHHHSQGESREEKTSPHKTAGGRESTQARRNQSADWGEQEHNSRDSEEHTAGAKTTIDAYRKS